MKNPYENGVFAESWKRGYDGIRFIGYSTSAAHKVYKQGKQAKKDEQKANKP